MPPKSNQNSLVSNTHVVTKIEPVLLRIAMYVVEKDHWPEDVPEPDELIRFLARFVAEEYKLGSMDDFKVGQEDLEEKRQDVERLREFVKDLRRKLTKRQEQAKG
jgi:hypothetical protein